MGAGDGGNCPDVRGRWDVLAGREHFRPIGREYEFIANNTELGKEQTEDRQRGKTAEDVAALLSAGLEKRKLKAE